MTDSLYGSEDDLGETGRITQAFSTELRSLRDGLSDATRDLGGLERGLTGGLRRAIDGLVIDGGKLSDALATVGRSMADAVYRSALRPVTNHLGGLVAGGLSGAVSGMMPFAKGGIVSQATPFGMRGGMGVMGEAGPEAIMPLARGPDGRLGVSGSGGGASHVTINVTTPDVAGFRRSQSQIAAEMSRLMGRGSRNR